MEDTRILFVRGADMSGDNDIIMIHNQELFEDIKIAIAEYNEEHETKFFEETKAIFIHNFANYKMRLFNFVTDFQKKASYADNMDKLMTFKRDFLVDLINLHLPLQRDCCPFCIQTNMYCDCDTCKYGKKNGICCEKNSTYSKITKERAAFADQLKKYW